MLHEPIELINKRLDDTYGRDITNKPKYRIVLADTQFEKRLGTYRDYADEGRQIFLREVVEVREVYKYAAFLGYYILEKKVDCPANMFEIKQHNGYECLWVFRYKNGNQQELYWRAIAFLVDSNLSGYRTKTSDVIEQAKKIEKAEMEYFMAYLENEETAFNGTIGSGESVIKTVNTKNGEVVNG